MGIWGATSTAKGAAAAAEQAGGCRRCDFCEEARALVYCRADSARLCLACDRHVHAANAVCSRHPRALLCDACLSAPSSILLCSSHYREGGQHPRLLCPNCDFDALHGEADGNKAGERRAVEPYSGCPTAVEMLALLGVSVEKEKSLLQDGGGSTGWLDLGGGGAADAGSSLLLAEEEWVWETPLILSMEDIIVPTYPCRGFQAMGVPPPPKDRHAACGKHRDEILRQLRDLVKSEVCVRQLRDLAKSEVCVSSDFGLLEADMGSQSPQEIQLGNMISNAGNDTASVVIPDPPPKVLCKDQIDGVPASCSEHQLEMPMEKSRVFLDGPVDTQGSVSDAGSSHLMSREDQPSFPPKCGYKLSGVDRDNVLSRYKEKREKRRFDKQIRYQSRKVRADGRMRIKGRFAKVNQNVLS